jgi:hypothetical protein
MTTHTFTVDFNVPDDIKPADIKDAVGAAIRTFLTHNPDMAQQQIIKGLTLRDPVEPVSLDKWTERLEDLMERALTWVDIDDSDGRWLINTYRNERRAFRKDGLL